MSAAPQSPRLVVLVEDSSDCSAALELALVSGGSFRVCTCGSAEEALELLQRNEAAGVVTDIHLPGISGLALIRELRQRDPGLRLKIVAVTGDSDPELKDRALAAGAHAFLPKPYSPREVCRLLEELIDED